VSLKPGSKLTAANDGAAYAAAAACDGLIE
jgi:hypothetical protein